MKPVDRRKLMAAIRRSCDDAGLEIEEDPDAGSGSHGSLLFSEPQSGRRLRVVIVYAREISPGVQRGILQSLAQRAESDRLDAGLRAFAQRVHDLLEAIFDA